MEVVHAGAVAVGHPIGRHQIGVSAEESTIVRNIPLATVVKFVWCSPMAEYERLASVVNPSPGTSVIVMASSRMKYCTEDWSLDSVLNANW